jgi:hypothetical protein
MNNSGEFGKSIHAFDTALELWKLASQQIYSRFSAMLTANSIIIAVIGLAIANNISIPGYLLKWFIGAGWALCVVWAFYVFQGVRVEAYYRKKAEEFEKSVIPNGKQLLIKYEDRKYRGFTIASFITISVFIIIYSILMYSLII